MWHFYASYNPAPRPYLHSGVHRTSDLVSFSSAFVLSRMGHSAEVWNDKASLEVTEDLNGIKHVLLRSPRGASARVWSNTTDPCKCFSCLVAYTIVWFLKFLWLNVWKKIFARCVCLEGKLFLGRTTEAKNFFSPAAVRCGLDSCVALHFLWHNLYNRRQWNQWYIYIFVITLQIL